MHVVVEWECMCVVVVVNIACGIVLETELHRRGKQTITERYLQANSKNLI